MNRRIFFIGSCFLSVLLGLLAALWPLPVLGPAGSASGHARADLWGKLPMAFALNDGQLDLQARFFSRGVGYSVFFTPTEIVLVLYDREPLPAQAHLGKGSEPGIVETAVLRMKLIGGNSNPKVSSLEQLPGKSNYFIGSDPKKWRTDIPNYAKIKYESVYPGIDLVYYGNQKQLEFDFIVAPGADPELITFTLHGADRIEVTPGGSISVQINGSVIGLRKPKIYQDIGGFRKEITGAYKLKGEHQIAFQVASYDRTTPLVIDPVLEYSTSIGGSSQDEGHGIAVDGQGNAYITGYAHSADFPTINAFQPTRQAAVNDFSSTDAFVAKLSPDGSTLLYSTYLGGTRDDRGMSIAVDASGSSVVTGHTTSNNFPTANAVQPGYVDSGHCANACPDAFVTKLNPEGNGLLFSTYLGGSGHEQGLGIAVDANRNVYVTGETISEDFPITAGAFQPTPGCRGCKDGFVSKITPEGAMSYSTYLGGSAATGNAVAVDAIGNAYITGFATSQLAESSFAAGPGGGNDVFVAKLNATGTALLYAAHLGGSGTDRAAGIALDSSGNAYITGETSSTDFPTVNALKPVHAGGNCSFSLPCTDAFVAKLDSTGSSLVYSTYLGGTDFDSGRGIAVDGAGNAHVVGWTQSTDFPMADAFQPNFGAGENCTGGPTGAPAPCPDAFVTKLNSEGSAVIYSSYFGRTYYDEGTAIALDSAGNAYITGINSLVEGTNVVRDAFILKIADSGTGTTPTVENVIWTNTINATANGNSLEKACSNIRCANAGAVSQQSIVSGDGYVEFTAAGPELLYIGLSRGSIGTGFSEIEFALRLHHRKATVWENGVAKNGKKGKKASIGFRRGDVFRVAIFCGVVEYSKNGTVFYSSDVAPTYPLLVDTSLIGREAIVSAAMIAGNL